ncbi:MAG: hypothetical protein IID36_00120 [Planctomycetes bacterium]|nr:hypothetical protein [Planctomycetota bacterium]
MGFDGGTTHGFAFANIAADLRVFIATDGGLADFSGTQFDDFGRLIEIPACPEMGDIAISGDGTAVVSCPSKGTLVKIDLIAGTAVEDFSCCGDAGSGFAPFAVAVSANGVVVAGTDAIEVFDLQTGEFLMTVDDSDVDGVTAYDDYAFASDGNLLVSASGAGILEFDAVSFEFVRVLIPPGTPGLEASAAIAFDNDGNLVVGSGADGSVRRFSSMTGELIEEVIGPNISIEFIEVRP